MSTNVYNVVWADDEIDTLLDENFKIILKDERLEVIDVAHNGIELERVLLNENRNKNIIDAIIVDANFNEGDRPVESERNTSGLDYSRLLYHKINQSIPMFLFSARPEDELRKKYEDNPELFNDFPRKERWFKKGDENDELFEAIRQTVDEMRTPSFVVRNRFSKELKAAEAVSKDAYNFIFDFLQRERESEEKLKEIIEPFNTMRKILEGILHGCISKKFIPPIDEFNGIGYYFLNGEHDKGGIKYKMIENSRIIPKPIASILRNMIFIVQDGSHNLKDKKKDKKVPLKVHDYYSTTKDTLFLRSLVYTLIDFVKWYANTAEKYKGRNPEEYAKELWCECPQPASDKTENADAGNTNSTES